MRGINPEVDPNLQGVLRQDSVMKMKALFDNFAEDVKVHRNSARHFWHLKLC